MTDVPATSCSHAGRARLSGRGARFYAALAGLLLAAPLVVARLLDPSIADEPGACPLLHATGVPCPACGATRAFVLLAHGDGSGALRFNWAWIVLWAAAVALLGLAAWRRMRGGRAMPAPLAGTARWLQSHPAAVVALPFLLMAGPWAVAMANLPAIR